MRFEVLTAVKVWMFVFWVSRHVILTVLTNVSEELTASILRIQNYFILKVFFFFLREWVPSATCFQRIC